MAFGLAHAASAATVQPGVLDWVNFWLAVLGIVLTVVGFAVAIQQIRKTKKAAEAAAAAVTVGTVRIRYNQLLILAPQMQNLEGELDNAVKQEDAYAAERVLLRWRQLATTAHGVLGQMGEGYGALVEDITTTRGLAIATKGKLSESRGSRSVSSLVATVRKDMSRVNDDLGSMVGRLATEVPAEEGN